MTFEPAEQALSAVIGCSHFAELFACNDHAGMFDMENPT